MITNLKLVRVHDIRKTNLRRLWRLYVNKVGSLNVEGAITIAQ